jgi:hypothetical protein
VINDGRWWALLGLLGLTATAAARGSRAEVRTGRTGGRPLRSPSSPRDAVPLTEAEERSAWDAGYEAASKDATRGGVPDPESLFVLAITMDGRLPVRLSEDHPSFWEWEQAFRDGVVAYSGSRNGSRGIVRQGRSIDRFPVVLYAVDGGDNAAVWAGSFEDFLVDNELDDDEKRRIREREEVYLGGGAAPLMLVRRHRPNTVRRIREKLGSRGIVRQGRSTERTSVRIDDPGYVFYVVATSASDPLPGVIESGWEYKEDAIERAKAFREELDEDHPLTVRVLSRRKLLRDGVDPRDDGRWLVAEVRRSL